MENDYDFMDEAEEFELIELTDKETGESIELVVVDSVDYKGSSYLLVIAREEFDDECPNASIVKGVQDENDEYIYVTVDDDDEFERIAELFELEA